MNETFRHWSVDRRVNISHIVATLMLAAALVGAFSRLSEQVAVQGAIINELRVQINRTDAFNAAQTQQLRDELKSLREETRATNVKLDRLIEISARR